MKKDAKTGKKKDEYKLSLDDKNEIIKEIILLDETEIFNNEFNSIKEVLNNTDPSIKNVILSNFLINKLEEIEKQLKLAQLAKNGNIDSIKSLIDIDNIERTKELIIDHLTSLNNHFDEAEVNVKTELDEAIVYDIKVVYSEGSDNYPQMIKLKLNKNCDFNTFTRELKKSLDIYEFAKFQIVLMEKNNDIKFLDNIGDLKIDEENQIKIVPLNYVII
jgi:hypothetical protein